MASELKELRDHARSMAKPGAHLEDCIVAKRRPSGLRIQTCTRTDAHDEHGTTERLYNSPGGGVEGGADWIEVGTWCPGVCAGCVPADHREQWTRIADELDAFLARDDDAQEALL